MSTVTTQPRKLGVVLIRKKPISEIRPSPENAKLYRPINPSDPDIAELAESVAQHGILTPIKITLDGWIISGHRRYAAALRAGLTTVPYEVVNFFKDEDHDRFMVLLREENRQRVKSLDEQLREAVVDADPEESYESLIAYRTKQTQVDADEMEIPEARRRAVISDAKAPMLSAIQKVIRAQREYWPLSDRRIHYALLNDPPLIHASKPASRYANDKNSYRALTELLTRARLEGLVPMNAIDDPTRPVVVWNAHQHPQMFIRSELGNFLKGYWRNLMQSQPNHIEIFAEKNTVAPILKPVAGQYCIPLTTGRGFCSIPPRRDLARRFRESGKDALTLLVVSDFDPDGERLAESFASSMRDEFHVRNIRAVKVALKQEHITRFNLPPGGKAKEGSASYDRFVDKYGDDVYELEAIPPAELQTLLTEAVDSVLDVDAFNHELDQEREDSAYLDGVRQRVKLALSGLFDQEGNGQ